jgi:CSLREA domain-containing protein
MFYQGEQRFLKKNKRCFSRNRFRRKIMNMKNTFMQFAVIVFVSFAFISSVEAVTFTVNTTLDTVDAVPGNGVCLDSSGFCSLRAAIIENNHLPLAANTLILPAGTYTLTIPNSTIGSDEEKGDLNFSNRLLTIIGSNARTTIIQAGTIKSTNGTDGNGIDRIFNLTGNPSLITQNGLDIQNVTLRNGKQTVAGAINLVSTTVYLTNVTMTDNFANNGSGIQCALKGQVTIRNSTLTSNIGLTGGSGGVIYLPGAVFPDRPCAAEVTNTTISGNTQALSIQNGINTLTNCTITNNKDSLNFSGVNSSANTSLRNTIIANNFTGPALNVPADVTGAVTSGGTNLIGTVGTSSGWIGSDLLNNTSANLGALANNGGQTDTHAIFSTSSALNAGQNCVLNRTCGTFDLAFNLTTDQRGQNRLVNGFSPTALFVDIGAYEKQIPTAASASINGRVTTASGRGIRNVRMSLTNQTGETSFAITNSFGYYRFQDLPVGETYILSVNSKRYSFAEPTRVISFNEDLTDENFVSDSK